MTEHTTELFFDCLKESRRGYFVEYQPPGGNISFAELSLVFYVAITPQHASECMEKEAQLWLQRFPIPVMVSSFDEKGGIVDLHSVRACNHLIAWIEQSMCLKMRWELIKDEEVPQDAYSIEYLLKVYASLTHRTKKRINGTANRHALQIVRQHQFVYVVLVIWGSVPLVIALLGLAHPLIGCTAFIYALYKFLMYLGRLRGWIKPSQRVQNKTERERRKEHYFYHCERNPDSFMHLKIENFETDERISIKKEAEELRKSLE